MSESRPDSTHAVRRSRPRGRRNRQIDVAVLGRVGIDLYPNQLRTPLREVRTYTRFVGGFAGNVATGLARLGLTPAIVSRVGPDPHGEFVRDFLAGEGVDVRFLAVDERLMTPPTFCEVWPPDNFPITFYRYPTAPDWQLAPEDFDADEVAAAPFLLATGTGLAQSPSRETTLAALAAHRGTTIFDLDWRPTLWERAGRVRRARHAAAAACGHRHRQRGGGRAAAGDPTACSRSACARSSSSAASAARSSSTTVAKSTCRAIPSRSSTGSARATRSSRRFVQSSARRPSARRGGAPRLGRRRDRRVAAGMLGGDADT